MERRRENFKPLRELVGMSQAHLAKELGIDPRNVRRWEELSKQGYNPMPAAWDLLEEKREAQLAAYDAALSMIDRYEESGIVSDTVTLTYWPNAIVYAGRHPEEDPANWQMANANTRLIAHQLMEKGYNVEFGWPGLKSKIEELWKGEGWYTVREWDTGSNGWRYPEVPAPHWFESLYDFEVALESLEDEIEYNVEFNGNLSLAERSDGLWSDSGKAAEPFGEPNRLEVYLNGSYIEVSETERIVMTGNLERCRVFECDDGGGQIVYADGKWSQWDDKAKK